MNKIVALALALLVPTVLQASQADNPTMTEQQESAKKKSAAQLLAELPPSPAVTAFIQTVKPVITTHQQTRIQLKANPNCTDLQQQHELAHTALVEKMKEVSKKYSSKQRLLNELLSNGRHVSKCALFQLSKDLDVLVEALSAASKEILPSLHE